MSRRSRISSRQTRQRSLVWLGEPTEPEPEPEPELLRRYGGRRVPKVVANGQRRVRSRGVGGRGAQRGLAPLNKPSSTLDVAVSQHGVAPLDQACRSMPAGALSQQLRELGVQNQPALPNARSMPANTSRLTPLPGIEVTVEGGQEPRKQLFGGSSVPSTGSFNKKARDMVLDHVVVTRGREIATQIAEADRQIEGSGAAKRTAAEAAKHKLMAELKDNQEVEMVVLNIRLGLREDKPWGDRAFSPVLHSAPVHDERRLTEKKFGEDVVQAATLIVHGASETDGSPKVRSTDRQARAPVEVEDEQFTTAFNQMELALKQWPSLPSDDRDPLKVDRRVSDCLIDAIGSKAPFRVVWWRVIEELGYIPHSDESDRVVPITIYRRRCTIGRMGNTVAPFWQETEPPTGESSDTDVEKLVLQCHVIMSVSEAHDKVLEANLGEGLAQHGGFAYNETDALAVDLEFFSHRWIRPWWSGPSCDMQPVRGSHAHVSYNAHPDCEYGSKARSLALYGRAAANTAHDAKEKFYWIDFVCIDQRSPSAGIGMLPLYLANCDNLSYHDHAEYGRRGWTMLERTVFAAFNKPLISVLQPRLGTLESGRPIIQTAGGIAPFSGRSLRTSATRTLHVLDDPADGLLTDPDTDRPLIARLLDLTQKRWAMCWRGSRTQWSLQSMRGLDRLEFGVTEVVVETAPVLDVVGGGSGRGAGAASSALLGGSSFIGSGTIGRRGSGNVESTLGTRHMDPMASLRQMELRMKERRRQNTPWQTVASAAELATATEEIAAAAKPGVRLARMVASQEGVGKDFVMPNS